MSEDQKAKMIRIAARHDCLEAVTEIDREEYYIGSIAECFCGKQFIKADSQRDGMYWRAF